MIEISNDAYKIFYSLVDKPVKTLSGKNMYVFPSQISSYRKDKRLYLKEGCARAASSPYLGMSSNFLQ